MVVDPEALVIAILTIAVFATLCAALFLVVMSLRRPKSIPLIAAVSLVTLALVIVLVVPRNVPIIAGLVLALLAITLAVVGGNPLTRRVLEVATNGRIDETSDGGIRVALSDTDGAAEDSTLTGVSADTRRIHHWISGTVGRCGRHRGGIPRGHRRRRRDQGHRPLLRTRVRGCTGAIHHRDPGQPRVGVPAGRPHPPSSVVSQPRLPSSGRAGE